MLESNISGLFGMSTNNDNDSDYDFNRNDFQSRKNRQRKHYIESGYKIHKGIDLNIDTGEILNFVPKKTHMKTQAQYNAMLRRSARQGRTIGDAYGNDVTHKYNRSSGIKMPDISKLLPFAMYGAIGYVGYKLYNKFFGNDGSSLIADITNNGKKDLAKTFVDNSGTKAAVIQTTAASLAVKGLNVSPLHQSLANTFHDMLDSLWVDHAKIIRTIKAQNVQTFRLISVAYGTRSLPTYGNSPAHIFNADVWSLSNLMNSNKLTGTLKDHLKEVLTSSELSQIHGYISVI